MKFNFRAVKNGETISGSREAADRFSLAREMRREGVTLLSAEAVVAVSGLKLVTRRFRFWERVSLKEKIIFAGSLGTMIGAGLSLARALQVITKQSPNRYWKKVLNQLNDSIVSGRSLSQALTLFPEIFPPVMTAMISAGEESGKLALALETIREQLAKHYELRRRVQGAMIYPLIIIVVIIILAILLLIFLVPNLTSLFRELEVELPLSTRIVIAISGFLSHYTVAFLLGLFLVSAAGWRLFKTQIGRRWWARFIFRLPVIGTLVRNFNAATTMRTLSSLIASGVSMISSLQITVRVLQNPFYQEVIERAVARIERGVGLSLIFSEAEQLYPPLAAELTEVGEETGNLSGMLEKGATMFEAEVDQTTKNLSAIIEPLLMIIIGVAVGFFAISMIGPIYSLSDKL